MLQYQTVSPGTVTLIRQLMLMPEVDPFLLAGGTSLSLQLGHRMSVDLDFLADKSFDADSLSIFLTSAFSQSEILQFSEKGFTCNIKGIKCVFSKQNLPFIEKPLVEEGIRLCSLKDIAAFKLDAISTKKEKKDFWDIDALLNCFNLSDLLSFHQEKFSYVNIKVVLDALCQIDIADKSKDTIVVLTERWYEIKQRIKERWLSYINEKLDRKEQEKRERLKTTEELLRNKKSNNETLAER